VTVTVKIQTTVHNAELCAHVEYFIHEMAKKLIFII